MKAIQFNTKESYIDYSAGFIKKNYDEYSQYINCIFDVFDELRQTVYQIASCLIFEHHSAAITLTNHFVERLLKIALIKKQVGIRAIPVDQWSSIFQAAHSKYGSINLYSSIEHCKKEELITDLQFNLLLNEIREQVRNGYSHGDSDKVLVNLPEQSEMYLISGIGRQQKMERVNVNQKVMPEIQERLLAEFALHYAPHYFKFAFNLLDDLEKKLQEFDRAKHISKP